MDTLLERPSFAEALRTGIFELARKQYSDEISTGDRVMLEDGTEGMVIAIYAERNTFSLRTVSGVFFSTSIQAIRSFV